MYDKIRRDFVPLREKIFRNFFLVSGFYMERNRNKLHKNKLSGRTPPQNPFSGPESTITERSTTPWLKLLL
jgi:hypothetical protein